MRRGLLFALVLAALVTAPGAHARSWAQPQIRIVVASGLMGPSVENFRPQRALTRGALGTIVANLTGKPQVVADPARQVTLRELDRALVRAAGLGAAAATLQQKAKAAGLQPPARFGSEAVARLLWLRFNHPASQDWLELRPQDVVTRAETAYSVAHVMGLDDGDRAYVTDLARRFSLPAYTSWKKRVLGRALDFIGYPYIWGGTSENRETLFGVTSRGGFDCSGFVWRVFKLQLYPEAPQLQSVLKGRTTYQMSGEFPRRNRIAWTGLRPADLVFFGARGPLSAPTEVDHMGIYLGRGWMIHSSSQGVAIVPLAGWYEDRFAWGRRALREAGLA
jgi:cell wall-associated NlpC family hydrolase